jgi:hypothetical protein
LQALTAGKSDALDDGDDDLTGILDFASAEERSEYVVAISADDDADMPAARRESEVDPTLETNSNGGDAGVRGDTDGDEAAREGHDEPETPGQVGSTPLPPEPPDSGDTAAVPESENCEPTSTSPDAKCSKC